MSYILWGLALFLIPHFLIYTPARAGLQARLGEKGARAVLGLPMILGFLLLIPGYWASRAGPLAADWLWYPPEGLRPLALLLPLPAMVLIAATFLKGHIKRLVRNPMDWGFLLWAGGHLLATGKLAAMLIFGGFALLALVDLAVETARGTIPAHRPSLSQDAIALGLGLGLYAAFAFWFHPLVLNLPVLP